METNIWLKAFSTATVMSHNLALCGVKRMHGIFTGSYYDLVRNIFLSSSQNEVALIKQEFEGQGHNSSCKNQILDYALVRQDFYNVPFSVRAQILPLNHWNTSLFYSASLKT